MGRPKDLQALSPADYDDLRKDPDGHLYWRGKRVRVGGWGLGQYTLLVTFFGVIVALLASWDDVISAANDVWLWLKDLLGFEDTSQSPNPPQNEQEFDNEAGSEGGRSQ